MSLLVILLLLKVCCPPSHRVLLFCVRPSLIWRSCCLW